MKTTVEISDSLFAEARRLVRSAVRRMTRGSPRCAGTTASARSTRPIAISAASRA
jgi:hypothetical protein